MNNKTFSLKDLVLTIVITAVLLFIHVLLVGESNSSVSHIETANQNLELKNDQIQKLDVVKQQLLAESRIVKIANDSLGLTRSENLYEILRVNKKDINKIERIISDKYGR